MKLKETAIICILIMILNIIFCYAKEETILEPISVSIEDTETVKAPLILTVEGSVKTGLENSINMKVIDNEIGISEIALEKAGTNKRDLEKANSALNKASSVISANESAIAAAQVKVDAAKAVLDKGYAPIAIKATDSSGNSITIPQGAKISDYVADDKALISATKNELQAPIDENSAKVSNAKSLLPGAQSKYNEVLESTAQAIGSKIDFNSITTLTPSGAGNLMVGMANISYNITKYAKDIYKNQIAMLIQKRYYDALYEQKLLELKKTAMERGQKQADIVKLSYDNGFKAKDDLLIANMYYNSTIIAYQQQEGNYDNALYELKKNMNIDLDTQLVLTDNMITEITEENLEDGLKSALSSRLEIQQATGQLTIYQLNEQVVEKIGYSSNAYPVREAKLLLEKAENNLQSTKLDVNNSVRQSYKTMTSTEKMIQSSRSLVDNAKEVVEIAQLKYEQGFGAENSLLKDLNLEESSGTIVELIAAQEKLSDVEAQIAQLTYGYTMAKIKYQNDIGKLTY